MPYTTLKRLSVQTAGSNPGTWGAGGTSGDDLNTGVMGLVDTQLAGVSTFTVGASNVSLAYSDIQNCLFRFTGTLTASIVVSPAAGDATTYFNGFYYFENLTTGNFTITVTTADGSVVLPQGRRGILFVSAVNNLAPRLIAITDSNGDQPVPTGSVMLFYQNAAPAGWTISSSLNDYALKIVSSSGGVASGSVNYSTLFARTATDGYTLQIADIPPHTHSYTGPITAGFTSGNQAQAHPQPATPATTGSTGGGGAHSHNIDMRVKTAAVILATKN